MSPGRAFDTLGYDVPFTVLTPPPGPPPPPGPSFTLSVMPSTQTVIWGQSTTYQVTVNGRNGFSGQVRIDLCSPPPGIQASFSTAVVAAGGSTNLTVATTEAQSQTGTSTLEIRGIESTSTSAPCSGGFGLRDRVTATLTVHRTQGAFTAAATPATSTQSCGMFLATSVAIGSPGVQFSGPSGNLGNPVPSVGWVLSPRCRAAVAVLPVPPGGLPQMVGFFNLGFPRPPAQTTPGFQVDSFAYPETPVFFSPDDSLVVTVGPAGPGSLDPQIANGLDMLRQTNIGSHGLAGVINQIQLTPQNRIRVSWTDTRGQAQSWEWPAP